MTARDSCAEKVAKLQFTRKSDFHEFSAIANKRNEIKHKEL